MTTWLAIINPKAGFSRSEKWCKSIAQRLRDELRAEVIFTQRPGHASELAAASQTDALAVFGGDGTVAEVVNGMDLGRQLLLILSGGTGNGLARDLGLMSLENSLAAARSHRLRSLDLVQVVFQIEDQIHSRLAISTASIGYAAEVVVLANRYFKWLGPWCYPFASTLQAARQQALTLLISIDEGMAGERVLSNVMINNTRHAGNFRAFRHSDPDDGRMEILLALAGFGNQLLHNFAVLTRTYFYATAQEIMARTLDLELPSPQRLMVDGELWDGVTRVRFEVLPGKLKCMV